MEKDLIKTRDKLYQMLVPSGWALPLRSFIHSKDFIVILDRLYEESIEGNKFTPKLSQVFRAFMECPYDKVKVVIIGQDPYPNLVKDTTIADGIAFSCSNTGVIQKSLEYIFGELKTTIYKDKEYKEDPDLTRWANQGVLLLNSALTTSIGTPGRHALLWKGFTSFVIDNLVWTGGTKAWVFMGKKAQEFMDLVPDNNLKIRVFHPASAAYNNTVWKGDNMFVTLDDYCKETFNTKIIW